MSNSPLIFNEIKTLQEWLIDSRTALGLYPKLFRIRIRQGMTPEEALTRPVRKKPNGMGQYLYGCPLKLCEEIAPNYCVLPEHPEAYVYWLSTDKLSNIHCRSGRFKLVRDFKVVGEYGSYLEAFKCRNG